MQAKQKAVIVLSHRRFRTRGMRASVRGPSRTVDGGTHHARIRADEPPPPSVFRRRVASVAGRASTGRSRRENIASVASPDGRVGKKKVYKERGERKTWSTYYRNTGDSRVTVRSECKGTRLMKLLESIEWKTHMVIRCALNIDDE